jgi:hypothetical protein
MGHSSNPIQLVFKPYRENVPCPGLTPSQQTDP